MQAASRAGLGPTLTCRCPWPAPGAAAAATTTYTVKAGDTLSKIAKEHLGDANAYMAIFEANRDQLTDPDGFVWSASSE